jgi:hypothetical protein
LDLGEGENSYYEEERRLEWNEFESRHGVVYIEGLTCSIDLS